MKLFIDFQNKLVLIFKTVFNQMKSASDLMVQTDEENLETLLKKPEDRVKFQKAIDEVLKDSHSQEINLNGRKVTISV